MTIYLSSDHAGFALKNHLVEYLNGLGYTAVDKGPYSEDPTDDYPDMVRLVTEEVLKEPHSVKGIVLGGSGQGEAIAANRMNGIRAAVYYGGALDVIRLSREHNDANILSLGARLISESEAEEAVKVWLETPFSKEERHARRIAKLDSH
ncbi:MAG TPA: RpiB/LacA/LacB family sugar-phosphate isomerase [Candidatus Paceibacterota bacterium]|nr:RpiB/LacA/LacB family sugar-phosphate isomerase [Candidatus Paceibacterota bacterium]